ncbi:MAG: hypothetical protein ABI704_23660 [Kofleriaceae bacterium]
MAAPAERQQAARELREIVERGQARAPHRTILTAVSHPASALTGHASGIPSNPAKPAVIVATGPGPRWLRIALGWLAAIYLVALVKHPPQWGRLHAVGIFTECTCLFPSADKYSIDFRLDGWSCSDKKWEPIDPRAYFPIQADDKESRFQRFSYFYAHNQPSMLALERWIETLHGDRDDGITGSIGGIRITKWTRTIPEIGSTVERYQYRPLDKVPKDQRKDLWWTQGAERKARCGP